MEPREWILETIETNEGARPEVVSWHRADVELRHADGALAHCLRTLESARERFDAAVLSERAAWLDLERARNAPLTQPVEGRPSAQGE